VVEVGLDLGFHTSCLGYMEVWGRPGGGVAALESLVCDVCHRENGLFADVDVLLVQPRILSLRALRLLHGVLVCLVCFWRVRGGDSPRPRSRGRQR